MAAMTKRVNARIVVPVKTTTPPIPTGTIKNVIMSTSDIMKCLVRRAIIDEILPDGSTVRLNMSNYFTDNGAGLDAYAIKPAVTNPEPAPAKPEIPDAKVEIISGSDLEPQEEVKEDHPVVVEESKVEEPDVTNDTPSEESVEVPDIEDSNDGYYPKKKNKHNK